MEVQFTVSPEPRETHQALCFLLVGTEGGVGGTGEMRNLAFPLYEISQHAPDCGSLSSSLNGRYLNLCKDYLPPSATCVSFQGFQHISYLLFVLPN